MARVQTGPENMRLEKHLKLKYTHRHNTSLAQVVVHLVFLCRSVHRITVCHKPARDAMRLVPVAGISVALITSLKYHYMTNLTDVVASDNL